jgi:DNA-binding MarR family transcriptional regulator
VALLAKTLRLAPRSITQSIDGLERSGLVERHPDPDDQRCKLVRLTPKGRAALTTGMEAGQGLLRSIFGALGPDRQADLDVY